MVSCLLAPAVAGLNGKFRDSWGTHPGVPAVRPEDVCCTQMGPFLWSRRGLRMGCLRVPRGALGGKSRGHSESTPVIQLKKQEVEVRPRGSSKECLEQTSPKLSLTWGPLLSILLKSVGTLILALLWGV